MIRDYFSTLYEDGDDYNDMIDFAEEEFTTLQSLQQLSEPPLAVQHVEKEWTKLELRSLKKCARVLAKIGKDWSTIHFLKEAEQLNGRSHEECYARWVEYEQSKPLSKECQNEIKKIAKQHQGRGWEEIARKVAEKCPVDQHVTPYSCFVHYQKNCDEENSTIRNKKWNTEEFDQLQEGVLEFGAGDWVQIALKVPTRNATQCQKKWEKRSGEKNDLSTAKSDWSDREQKALLFAVKIYGESMWQAVSKCIPLEEGDGNQSSNAIKRTPYQCKAQWDILKEEIEEIEAEQGEH